MLCTCRDIATTVPKGTLVKRGIFHTCLKGGNVMDPPLFLNRIKDAPILGVLQVAKRDVKH